MSRSGNVTVVSVTRTETRAAGITPLADTPVSTGQTALIEVDDVGVRGPSGTAGPEGPAGVTFISDAPPFNPTHGREWWQSNTGDHFVYYVDPSGPPGQWVQVNATTPAAAVSSYSFRRWVTQAQWDAILASTYTQSLSVEIQRAEDEVHDAGGGIITYPAGLFPVDGYKGSQASFSSSRKGGLYVRGGVYHVGVPGKTIWKNIADDWRCLVSIREGTDFGFQGITFDGDWPNRPAVALSLDAVRGEGIIFWNEISPVARVRIRDCTIKNTGHYGCGVQNVGVDTLIFENNKGENNGGDFIDIKDFPAYPKKAIHILGNTCDGIGKNLARVTDGDGPQTGFDIRGACVVSNNIVFNLDTYDDTQQGNDGFRVNADVSTDAGRLGGDRSILTGNRVYCSKLATEGSNSKKRIRGLVISDDRVTVMGHHNKGCYIGTIISLTGTGTTTYVQLHGVINESCRGELGDAMGMQIANGTTGHRIDVINQDCDIGFACSPVGNGGRVSNFGCTLGNNLSVAALAGNSFQFNNSGNTADANVAHSVVNFRDELTVWASANPRYTLQSSGSTWNVPYSAGGIDWYKQDVSGFGAGLAASVEFRFLSNSGATGALWFSLVDQTLGMVDALKILPTGIYPLKPIVLDLDNAPASATATGTRGMLAADTGFIYVCTATNAWKRVALATW